MTHYVYGSGFVGCLYDNGPHFANTKDEAVDDLVRTFVEELSDQEAGELVKDLHRDGIHYFAAPAKVGAHYCDVTEEEGPCPEESD